jgi:DNA-binding NtrC family response regulator
LRTNEPLRVFVLDDQPLIADTLVKVLETRGYEAYARYTTADILDLATEITPDLLIADVALGPDQITGIEVAIYFERFYPNCRVILISGNPTSAELHRHAREQGHDFLLLGKPIQPGQLLNIVEEIFERKAA